MKIQDLYREITDSESITLFVAPPIRFSHKQSDYLYLFYKEIFKMNGFVIKSLKSYTHFKPLVSNLFGKPSLLHYHWIECSGLLSLPLFIYKFLCLMLYKWTGGKMIWTVHNKMPMDGKFYQINYLFRRWMAKNADLLHIQCHSAIPEVSSFFGVNESKFRFVPHPVFPPELMPRAAAVEAINHRFNVNIKIQDRLFLMIGHISKYKQIDQVCDMFIKQPIQKKLVIAGPVKKGQMKLYRKLKKKINGVENIIMIPQFISEESVPEFLNASDYTIFNFTGLLTSGGVNLALSYKKPVIVPDISCIRELDRNELIFFKSREELEEIIDRL